MLGNRRARLLAIAVAATEVTWGRAGAGILYTCQEDGTILLLLRSPAVHDPDVWGVPGGAVGSDGFYSVDDDLAPMDTGEAHSAAERETREELGSLPSGARDQGQTVFHKGSFTYTTFIKDITLAEKERWTPSITLNWENSDAQWFSLERNELPSNLHPGLRFTLSHM